MLNGFFIELPKYCALFKKHHPIGALVLIFEILAPLVIFWAYMGHWSPHWDLLNAQLCPYLYTFNGFYLSGGKNKRERVKVLVNLPVVNIYPTSQTHWPTAPFSSPSLSGWPPNKKDLILWMWISLCCSAFFVMLPQFQRSTIKMFQFDIAIVIQ